MAAFCATENTEEKKPLCWFEAAFFGPEVFSSRGVSADIELDNLLGP